MSNTKTFTATLLPVSNVSAYIEIPFDVREVYGKGKIKVNATFDGEPYRGSLTPQGNGRYMLIVLKEIREKIGKQVGETVLITLQEDTDERTVEIPDDFALELEKQPLIKAAFEDLAFTHRKEFVRWIEDAKKAETRQRRMQKALLMIAEKKKL